MKNDQDFYFSRSLQLNFWLNFINKNSQIQQNIIFKKFISDSNFDEDFFLQLKSEFYYYPKSENICETYSKKIINVFQKYFLKKELNHLENKEEKLIKEYEIHYKNLFLKYDIIKKNILEYFKTIFKSIERYFEISNTLIFLKDNLSDFYKNRKEEFIAFSETAKRISEVNKENYFNIAKGIEKDFEVLLF